MKHGRNAFTLIELLVVISIIGILLAIGIGYAVNLREKANVLTCQSNMSQIGKAILSFTSDKGFLPGGQRKQEYANNTGLITNLLVYRQIIGYFVSGKDIEQLAKSMPPEVFHCPSDADVFGKIYDEDDQSYQTSYLYNLVEMTSGTKIDPTTSSGVVSTDPRYSVKPRTLGFFNNKDNWKNGINDPNHQEMLIDWTPWEEGQTVSSYRHFKKRGAGGEGSNVLFLDGHVEFVPSEPPDIVYEDGFDFFIDANPNDPDIKDRYWIRWFARKY